MISTSNKLIRPINFYPLNNLLQNITHLDILLVLLQHRLLQCYPSCFCQRFPQIQSRTNKFSHILKWFQIYIFSKALIIPILFLLTLYGWIEDMGACPMYQLFPASPLKLQIFFISLEPWFTYTFNSPIPLPNIWVQNLNHKQVWYITIWQISIINWSPYAFFHIF